MANTDAPFGLMPVGKILDANLYAVATAYGTAIYHYDFMQHDGESYSTREGGGIPGAELGASGAEGLNLGSVIGIFNYKMDPLLYLPSSTTGDGTVAGYVLIADHPMQEFLAQEDGETTPIAAASAGLCADLISTHAGDTTTGRGKMEIDSNTVNTTNTLAVKLLRVYKFDTVASAYCRWHVQVNSHFRGSNAAGIS